MTKSRVVLEHPPPSGLRNRLVTWTLGLLICCIADVGKAQGLQPQTPSVSPTRPEGFPAIDTLIERTTKLALQDLRTSNQPETIAIAGFSLPVLEPGASRAERLFYQSALRAVRQAYEQDRDDPAVLLSLSDKLIRDPLLAEVREDWATILVMAAKRAKVLESIRFPLRRLRKAYDAALFDDTYGIYRNLDLGACLRAARATREILSAGSEAVRVTVPPVGQAPLETFHTLCKQALHLELAEGSFPQELGTAAVRAEVAKAYRRFAPSQQLLKISVPKNWQPTGEKAELTASIGVEFPSDRDGFRCAVLVVTLSKNTSTGAPAKTTCCTLHKTTPINCKELRQ